MKYERESSPAVCQGAKLYVKLGSKLDKDAVEYISFFAGSLFSQFPENLDLLLVKGFSVRRFVGEIVPIHHSDSSPEATTDRFNGIYTDENFDISLDSFDGDMKFIRQMAAGVISSTTKPFQYSLAAFDGIHAFTPFPLLSVGYDIG